MTNAHTTPVVKQIEREAFLAAIPPGRVTLMRMRTETPGVHLLGLFTDAKEHHVLIQEIGPQGVHVNLAAAQAAAPAGLKLAYVVPCTECSPQSLPVSTPGAHLPASLRELKSPPDIAADNSAASGAKKTAFAITTTPVRPPHGNGKAAAHARQAEPTEPHPTPVAPPAHATSPTKTESPRTGSDSLSALDLTLEQMQLATRSLESLQHRELELRRERAEFQESCARRMVEIETHEYDLVRRENELALRVAKLNELLLQIDRLRRENLESGPK